MKTITLEVFYLTSKIINLIQTYLFDYARTQKASALEFRFEGTGVRLPKGLETLVITVDPRC